MEIKWEMKKRAYDDVISQLLYARGVIGLKATKSDLDKFINPDFSRDLGDPKKLPDISPAIKRIKKTKENAEKIGIYADYDADGIPGAAFLARALKKLNIEFETYIPSRAEGYGMSKMGIDHLIKKGVTLIVTVDMGIKNFEETKYCKEKNIDLIISDHHLPDKDLPKALAVINPKREDSEYPFNELSGAGVAFKIVEALQEYYPKIITERFLKWNLDLIAISTISDVVPLVGENRVIAKYGLIVMQKSKNIGINKLIESAKIDRGTIGAYHVGFLLGPRINAPGRIDSASKSYQLLVSDDPKESKEIAKFLEIQNFDRQEMMKQVEEDAKNKIIRNKLDKNKVIIVKGDWPKGVLGPSASNLVHVFGKPVILLSKDKNILSGSARSVTGVNIFEVISMCKKHIDKFGGHKGAAGLSLDMKKYDEFCKCMLKSADRKISDEDLIIKIKVDMELEFKELNHYLIKDLEKLEPHGMGNPRPVFMSQKVSIEDFRYVGADKNHLSMQLKGDSKTFKSIYFNYKQDKSKIRRGNMIDLVYNLEEDVWNGKRNVSLKVIDIK